MIYWKSLCVISLVLLTSSAAEAQYRPGDKIVVIADDDLLGGLLVEKGPVDKVWPGLVLTVTDVNGEWVWVNNGKPGRLNRSRVIPLDRAAIDRLTAMLRDKPNSSRLYSGRAEVWKILGEFDIALADYNEALRLDPNNATTYHNRGTVWHAKKDYDKALADYDETLRLDPKDAYAYNNRGLAWGAKKEYDKAIADYNEALRLDPKHAYAYNSRGRAWYLKQDYDKAIADYNEVLRLDPKNANSYIVRGNAWQAKKEYDKALADYNESLKLDPNYELAYANRGNAWQAKKEHDKALADYNEALRISPKDFSILNTIAWIRATCPDAKYRDGKVAIKLAEQACELTESKNASYLGTLAAAYAEAGQFQKAVETQTKARDLAPEKDKPDFEARLKLYQAGKPYREEAKK